MYFPMPSIQGGPKNANFHFTILMQLLKLEENGSGQTFSEFIEKVHFILSSMVASIQYVE